MVGTIFLAAAQKMDLKEQTEAGRPGGGIQEGVKGLGLHWTLDVGGLSSLCIRAGLV